MWELTVQVKNVWNESGFQLQQDYTDIVIDQENSKVIYTLEKDINANDTIALNSDHNVIDYNCIEVSNG